MALLFDYNSYIDMEQQGGLFGITVPTSLDAAKEQAKGQVQGRVTNVMQSDSVKSGLSRAEGVAGSVGLGDQFAKAKDATIGALERATGLSFSEPVGCTPDRIDVPEESNVLLATADTPYEAKKTMDRLFSYVLVDPKNPPKSETDGKSKLWYISIANSLFLIGFGILYGEVNK